MTQRIYLEEILSLLTLFVAVVVAFRVLDGKPAVALLWVLIGVALAAIPVMALVNRRLRDAQRYKRANVT